MAEERWVPIPGCEGCYEVSDEGRVRSWIARSETLPYALTAQAGTNGYPALTLKRMASRHSVHSLVMRAFVGEPPPGLEIRHLNGDKTDNRLVNLAYGTHSENMHDMVLHGGNPQANQTQCVNGHDFDEANTYVWSRGRRCCRACNRANVAKYAARKRIARGAK